MLQANRQITLKKKRKRHKRKGNMRESNKEEEKNGIRYKKQAKE